MSSKERPYRSHSPEFKAEAVRMVLEQKQRKVEVARNLGISPSLLDDWIKKYRETGCVAGPGSGKGKSQDSAAKRIRELERELERVKMERDILKKAAAYFAREST
jgi:transposase